MLYTDFVAGGKDYRLRLNTRNIIRLEKQLGSNPLAIFGTGETIPTITDMVNVLYCSLLQYHHGISLDDAYSIFDSYLADGNTTTDFINVILDIYRSSGIIKEEDSTEEGKN